ncbi:hypothetical protein B296_00053859, partial [Ensete ventricosum]
VAKTSPRVGEEKSSMLPSFYRRLRRTEGDEEKTAAKKSSPHEVLLIHGVIPRFSGRIRL